MATSFDAGRSIPDIGKSARTRVGFLALGALGIATAATNQMSALSKLGAADIHFRLTDLYAPGGLLERAPFPSELRAGIRGRQEFGAMRSRFDCQVIVAMTQIITVLCSDLMRRTPTMIQLDMTPKQLDRFGAYGSQPRSIPALEYLKWHANRRNFLAASALLPWSRWAADSLVLEYGVPRDKVQVVPPGISTDLWHPTISAVRQSKTQLLFVGGDFKRKGGFSLLRVFERIKTKADLHIVTRTPLEDMAGVTWYQGLHSNDDQLLELYRRCDVFVLPTIGDAFPMALLEASASGLALVSTNVGGIPDIVENGKNGLLIPPNDDNALESALRFLVEHPEIARRFGSVARTHSLERFDARTNASAVLQVAQELSRRPFSGASGRA